MALIDYDSDEQPVTQDANAVQEEQDEEADPTNPFNLVNVPSAATKAREASGVTGVANAAPFVLEKDIMNANASSMILRPSDTQMNINVTYQDMLQPTQGPSNPYENRVLEKQNTLTGHVEDHAMSSADFKMQQRSFNVVGYARNPSLLQDGQFTGDLKAAAANGGLSLEEMRPTASAVRAMKRKRKAKGQLGVFEADAPEGEDAEDSMLDPNRPKEYKGPWAAWEEEKIDDGPEYEEVEEEHVKRAKKAPIVERSKREVGFGEEKSVFHGTAMHDYQGRTYMSIPTDAGVDLSPEEPGLQQCYIPKKCIHTWSGHTKAVSAIQLFPKSGHLILSASMDTRVKLWDIYHEGKCLRTFMGHSAAVRDIDFSVDGKEFLSAGFDRQMKLWDTETGVCKQAFTNGKIPYCIRFQIDPQKPNVFLAGMSDKKIIQYDTRSGEITQEYDQHLGPVNTITFTDEGRRFVTTSDDKSMRAWDFDIPVVIKYVAEPTMHSMPACATSPNNKWLAMQSLDNQILIYSSDTFKQNRKKRFAGHTVAGYACVPSFSPDGKFISSGDGSGNVHFWDFKSGKKYPNRLQAHKQVVIAQEWLPHETSKLVTASWDSTIKLWD